jgi:hypothetical protein
MPHKSNLIKQELTLGVAVLLIAAAFRLNSLTYGLEDICLTVAEEYWLYETAQSSSLYTWNIAPVGVLPNLSGRSAPAPLVTGEPRTSERILIRFVGVGVGLLTIALVLRLARGIGAQWGWLAGLYMAVAPWFVAADRWMIRFDSAAFVITLCLYALWCSTHVSRQWQRRAFASLSDLSALSLLVVAPPLWWLTVLLLFVQAHPNWRRLMFILAMGVVLIPALQSPELWLQAAAQWDTGVVAGLLIVGIILALWLRPQLLRWQAIALAIFVMATGGVTLAQNAAHFVPNDREWVLIRWLQNRIPDDTVIQFDDNIWNIHPIVACPIGANIRFQAQSMIVPFFDVREMQEPYFIVTTDEIVVADSPYRNIVEERYWIGRELAFSNPVDIAYANIFYLLNYELVTPQLSAGAIADVRIDYQFGADITPDVLAYAGFIHVTPANAPEGRQWVNISVPFFEESGNTGARRLMLNQHIRFALPESIPVGSYDVRFGLFNFQTGQAIGNVVIIGQIRVR